MEMKLQQVTYNGLLLELEINSEDIIGITGVGTEVVLKVLALKYSQGEKITINKEQLTEKNITHYRKKISYISNQNEPVYFLSTVKNNMHYRIKKENIVVRDLDKKMKDSLKIVGLSPDYLNRKIVELSSSEQKLVQIAIHLLSNPEMIILEEPFLDLDMKNEKKIYMLLLKLKEQYEKTIIIASKNSDTLYKYTTQIYFVKNNKIWLTGQTKEIYKRVDYLTKNKFEVPEIVEFTYKVKKEKQVKLDYHIDIRDIIKDIYKHV